MYIKSLSNTANDNVQKPLSIALISTNNLTHVLIESKLLVYLLFPSRALNIVT